jgi:hypothetical protein
MSEKSISLVMNSRAVGEIVFTESPPSFELIRTACGTSMLIPASVILRWNDRAEPCPVVKHLRVIVSADMPDGGKLEFARIRDDKIYIGTTSSTDHPQPAELVWPNLEASLAAIQRNGEQGVPSLNLIVSCELYAIVRVLAKTPPNVIMTQHPTCDVLSYPHAVSKTITIKYPFDIWEQMKKATL